MRGQRSGAAKRVTGANKRCHENVVHSRAPRTSTEALSRASKPADVGTAQWERAAATWAFAVSDAVLPNIRSHSPLAGFPAPDADQGIGRRHRRITTCSHPGFGLRALSTTPQRFQHCRNASPFANAAAGIEPCRTLASSLTSNGPFREHRQTRSGSSPLDAPCVPVACAAKVARTASISPTSGTPSLHKTRSPPAYLSTYPILLNHRCTPREARRAR
ncbi:uncharacterized protein BDZ99DRAFT_515557 [Mytilinidion resinicola]|uniref:Uncharacterized protein n=1 Tax=Mytilinidion resinicola TaxID=574789 RepID=A0A6A6Z0T6_9PEZI|nr:uncharacterized protein BDZ99DRAFT_515557 [Mytilinidion resinicola]KAF2814782.1 hypothetical protein BDZ99DRAFT_515557 [Mytilinidion resinicola]